MILFYIIKHIYNINVFLSCHYNCRDKMINRMVDFNSVQNSSDCRADKSQIARSRIGPLSYRPASKCKTSLIFCFEFSNVLF